MKTILIIKPSSFGDIIHAMQVATVVARQIPHVKIDWIARDIFAPFVQNCEIISKVYVFERKKAIKGLMKLRSELKNENYDAVLDMQGLFRSGLMTRFANSPLKIGRCDAREMSGMFYNQKINFPETPKPHALEILMEFLPALGLEKAELREIKFKRLSDIAGLQNYVALFPGSRRDEKKWPYFKELTKMFLDARFNCVWAGAKGDAPDSDILELQNYSANFANLIGKTKLGDLPSVVNESCLAVCNDSGPMHLAAAMRKNILAIFGPTDPEKYGPYPLSSPANAVMKAPHGDLQKLCPRDVFNFCMEKFPSVDPSGNFGL